MKIEDNLIIVRGGGDLATGTVCKLYQCGYDVLVLEVPHPAAIRRYVSFSEAVYQGKMQVEGVEAVLAGSWQEARRIMREGQVAVLVDPEAKILREVRPLALVDAIIAKRNLGTSRDMAPVTVALGPGFEAGKDVDAVIETKRGHQLGRVLWQGSAIPNTGIPGMIAGVAEERVIHAERPGVLKTVREISDLVEKGEVIARIENQEGNYPVRATISGVLRGLIRDGFPVTEGFKIADIDPRLSERENCFTISDKSRCIAGGVVEAILCGIRKRGEK